MNFYLWEVFNNFAIFPVFNESKIGLGIGALIAILVGCFLIWLLIFYLGYRLIKYGVYHDSLLPMVVGVLLTGFWIGLIIINFLNKKRDKKMAEESQKKEKEEK